ncbi:META domain-containing protein [Flavobacterium rhizosphaerae]|uniref:META domain-containing protein n=1 Tax=Flavobacterium rhizosphaerae TaxID=3163298 RepID=A0ABW8YUL6_9FLAO
MKRNLFAWGFVLMFLLLAGCGSSKSASESMEILTATDWKLSSIKGEGVDSSEYPKEIPTVTFTNDLKITGNGGCNQFGGSYNINEENGINISELVSTKMFCEGVAENKFFDALNSANIIKITEDKLVLYDEADEVLTFVPNK